MALNHDQLIADLKEFTRGCDYILEALEEAKDEIQPEFFHFFRGLLAITGDKAEVMRRMVVKEKRIISLK